MFRRLGSSLANQRASLSTELGSLWDFIRMERDRRRSAPGGTFEHVQHESKSPVRLARDLLQVIQETVFSKKFDESPKRCPLVKEESDLAGSDDDEGDRRIANLIDFFFTIVRSQKEERKSSGGSCFKSEASPVADDKEVYIPAKVNTELEQKMETLIEFLAITGCMDADDEILTKKDERKITLMEFLFGADDKLSPKPLIEINNETDFNKGLSLSESNINVDLSYIDETPVEEGNETLVEMLMKYMDTYGSKEKMKEAKSMSITPSLSEKSKSDITISRLETFSDMSKTKSDSTLTHTQDTVIDRGEDLRSDKSRRISETVIDLSNVKQDLDDIFDEAVGRVCEARAVKQLYSNDTMTVQEDIENFNAYTNPALQYLPYSVELSDILEEDEPSSRDFDRKFSEEDKLSYIKHLAEELLKYIEDRIANYNFDDSEDEFDISQNDLKRSSISLIDLRNIPDLPPSLLIKPKVARIDKSTSTTEISDSNSDLSKRVDSTCMTDDTTLSSERNERALDKLQCLTKFLSSKSRLGIIDETFEDNGEKKSPKQVVVVTQTSSDQDHAEYKAGHSLDDVEDIQDDTDIDRHDIDDKKDDVDTNRLDSGDEKNYEEFDKNKCVGKNEEKLDNTVIGPPESQKKFVSK